MSDQSGASALMPGVLEEIPGYLSAYNLQVWQAAHAARMPLAQKAVLLAMVALADEDGVIVADEATNLLIEGLATQILSEWGTTWEHAEGLVM